MDIRDSTRAYVQFCWRHVQSIYLCDVRTLVLFVHSLEDFEELLGLFLVDFKLLHEGGPLIIFLNALGVSSVWISGTHEIYLCTRNHTQENGN